ncbi:MAG: hypothetical protein C3F11_04365 [Methylocystaceae bacterium]|nr:MAG: hypothetical protein C3F11_04365 [Methylocystaceae bacterium]
MLHGGPAEARKSAASLARQEQAPKNDPSHRHGFCSFCQTGSSPPPLDHYLPPAVLLHISWARPIFASYSDGILFFRVNHNAPARAPPSFS